MNAYSVTWEDLALFEIDELIIHADNEEQAYKMAERHPEVLLNFKITAL